MTIGYDRAGNQTSVAATRADGGTLTSFGYTYAVGTEDKELRQSAANNVSGETIAYAYDAFNRLARAQTTAGGSDDYAYDANGNRTSQTVNGATTTFTYNAANQLTSGPTTPTYDGNGNETTGPDGRTLVYNAKNQTTSITPPGGAALTMAYADADQTERVSAGATSFVSGPLGLGIATTAGSSTFYTRDDDGNLVGQITPSGARNYYLFDGLGSVVGLVDAAGNLSASYAYDPYGQAVSTTGAPWRLPTPSASLAATWTRRLG